MTATAAQPHASKHWPASIYRRTDGAIEYDLPPARLREIVLAGDGELWVDIDGTSMHQHALLEKVFEFHPLAVEDALAPDTRVKLEEYDRFLFAVMAGIRFDAGTPDAFDLATYNLYCFLGRNFLVTVHDSFSRSCDAVREKLHRSPDLLGRGVATTMHSVIDQGVDLYFPLIEELNDLVSDLEDRLFQQFDERLIHEIFKAKRAVFTFRRHVGPLRDVLNVLSNRPTAFIRPETQLYYRDVHDHTLRIVESLEATRDVLGGVLETYLSQTSNRMNRIMKQLSIVATIALPLVVVGGIFGMNFSRMPLVDHPLGFFWALITMAGVSAVILMWLKRQRWL